MIRFIFSVFILIFSSIASSAITDSTPHIKILLVDNKNETFSADTVRWWYSDRPDKTYTLECNAHHCAQWSLNKKIDRQIIISAEASFVTASDNTCWRLYQGKTSINKPTTVIKIVMSYKNKVCR